MIEAGKPSHCMNRSEKYVGVMEVLDWVGQQLVHERGSLHPAKSGHSRQLAPSCLFARCVRHRSTHAHAKSFVFVDSEQPKADRIMSNPKQTASSEAALPGAARHEAHHPQTKIERKKGSKAAELQEQKHMEEAEVNIENLNGHQLRALLDQRGISHKDCKNKAELVQRAMYHGVGAA